MYRCLLVDNDGTLMDFDAAEHKALMETFAAFSLPEDEGAARIYSRVNDSHWKKLERGETTAERLAVERFREFLDTVGHPEIDAVTMSAHYEGQLATHADLLPGAVELLRSLRGRMKTVLVSNGFSHIQRGRLSRSPIAPLLDAVCISGEVGVGKPDPRMIQIALEMAGCADAREAVLLGDSATADIAAARAAGIDSIHLRPDGRFSPDATYGARDLKEALDLLLSKSEAGAAARD